jgi:hypothetical protein
VINASDKVSETLVISCGVKLTVNVLISTGNAVSLPNLEYVEDCSAIDLEYEIKSLYRNPLLLTPRYKLLKTGIPTLMLVIGCEVVFEYIDWFTAFM